MISLHSLPSRLGRIERELAKRAPPATGKQAIAHDFAGDPVGYANNVLGVRLTPDQEIILRSLHIPPYRTFVPSGHDTGKTFTAAVAVSYWFDSFDPGVIMSTAPTKAHVTGVLWEEIRTLRHRAGLRDDFQGPVVPCMWTHHQHWARGYVSARGESFAGRHRQRMLFVIDEATGCKAHYLEVIKTMFDPELGHALLVIYNPIDPTSAVFTEENLTEANGDPRHFVWRLSALKHPNVLADLAGEKRPVPGAVTKKMVDEWVKDWCEPIRAEDREATDIEWPPGSGEWFCPGAIFQCRALGLWPDSGSGVWSDPLWTAVSTRRPNPPAFPLTALPQMGCDTAMGKGDDFHSIHGRWGPRSVHHETANTMDPARIFGRLKTVAEILAGKANSLRLGHAEPIRPQHVVIKIDDDGVGASLAAFLRRDGYKVVQVSAGSTAAREDRYPNKRSELWFSTADKARAGNLYLGDLDRVTLQRLKQQALAPTWDVDGNGRRVVEAKAVTKEKIGRSPDDVDSVNLAFYDPPADTIEVAPKKEPPRESQKASGGYGGYERHGGYGT